MSSVIVAGIGTDVGKTVVSAILCEALGADYWKPVQSGTDDALADATTIAGLISDGKDRIHPSTYSFRKSLSPHAAARIEGSVIDLERLRLPSTRKPLVIELAGGVMVPLNEQSTNVDLIQRFDLPVVVVSRHYLGSINHTLLTIEALRARCVPVAGIVFNGGDELPDTESVIQKLSNNLPVIARIPKLNEFTAATVRALATEVKFPR